MVWCYTGLRIRNKKVFDRRGKYEKIICGYSHGDFFTGNAI